MYYHEIDPVLLQLGSFKLYWYGVMYLLTMWLVWWLARRQTRFALSGWEREEVDNLLLYSTVGALLGARLGLFLFYQPSILLTDPISLLRIWEGGMSFHGGLIGGLLGAWLVGRHYHKDLFKITDFLVPLIPVGLFFIAIANFINGELWGRITAVPWAVIFQKADLEPRHPVQLYEAASLGLALFAYLWWQVIQVPPRRILTGSFLLGYGLLRVLNDMFRAADSVDGYLAWEWLTIGQLLSLPMIIAGSLIIYFAYKKKEATSL